MIIDLPNRGAPVFLGSIIKFNSFADIALIRWHAVMLAPNTGLTLIPFAICFDNLPLKP